ncbi:unnamed protein product [Phytomonas sp. EM1]|nr:unnamed protein product [Phytomonas sp. EM1]|eukprot:CCW62483.1 unnamed protein product [Phytomonas sp. isolate EM1]
MMFGIAIMFTIRKKIKKGIEPSTISLYLLLLDPVMTAYIVYLLWEIIWICCLLWRYTESSTGDPCRDHQNAQVLFFLAYFLIGTFAFIFTFATEWFAMPRWRERAHNNWVMRQRQAMTTQSYIPMNHASSNDIQDTRLSRNTNGSIYYHREALPTVGLSRSKHERWEEVAHDYSTLNETISTAVSSMREGAASAAVVAAPLTPRSVSSTYSRASAGRLLAPPPSSTWRADPAASPAQAKE